MKDYLGIPAERWRNHVVIDLSHHEFNRQWLREKYGDHDIMTPYDQRDWATTCPRDKHYLIMKNHDDAVEYLLRW